MALRWVRDARRAMAKMPNFRMGRIPDGPTLPVRDLWPGDPARGTRLLKGELEHQGAVLRFKPTAQWGGPETSRTLLAAAHGFTWLRDLRALGTDPARARIRALINEWLPMVPGPVMRRPDVAAARITAWLGHWDFFAASAEDAFRSRVMGRLVADARALAADLPAEQMDARALTALKGIIAAAVALPDQTSFLTRALRFLPQEIARQVLPDGCHAERSPAVQLAALQDLIEIRALLQAAQAQPPAALSAAIDRMAHALRAFRHGDGSLALFNGTKEEPAALVDLVLAQAARGARPPPALPDGGFQRLQAGRTLLIADSGRPPPAGLDRFAHAGTLSLEVSIGRERLVVNCGAAPAAGPEWRDATRATAAHSTLVIADVNSSELKAEGLGRQPEKVEAQRQEANGAHWLEVSHDGYAKPFGAIHRRRLYLAESGEDIRGEDVLESASPQPFTLRFHLHPSVQASLQADGEAVLLRLPSGGGWRLRGDGARLTLEESIYLGGPEPKRAEQVVLTGAPDGPQQVKWALSKIG